MFYKTGIIVDRSLTTRD